MRLRINSVTPNIDNVIVDQNDDQYTFTTKIKFFARSLSRVSKDYFLIFCLNEEISNSLIGDPTEIPNYISRRKSNENVFIQHNTFNFDPRLSVSYAVTQEQTSVTVQTNISKDQIDYLTVIAVSARPMRLRTGTMYGVINKDMIQVFRDGAVPDSNVVLYENEGQTSIWLSEFYVDLQGVYRKPNGDRLYAKTVPNTKIVFKSRLNKQLLKTITNNFDSLFDFNKGLNTKKSIYNKLTTKSGHYFSDLFFAKTKNRELPLSFSFNKAAFYKNNSLFGRLIKNQSELLSAVELKSVRFVRKRVRTYKPSSRLTAIGVIDEYANSEEPITSEISYVDMFNNPGIITVQTVDKTMKDKTYGLYQYGVEMEFIDGTAQKITNFITSPTSGLSLHASQIKDILAEASLPNNYNVYSREFTSSYKSKYTQDYKASVIQAIKGYVTVLAAFYENFSLSLQESPNSLALKVYESINPMQNGPEGLQDLVALLDNLISELQLFVKRSSLSIGAPQYQNTKASNLGGELRIVKTKYFFKQVVDADSLVNSGYDYLSVQTNASLEPRYSNFRIVSYDEFSQLKTVEATKFEGLVFNQKDDLSLTPNYFSLNGRPEKINLVEPETENNDNVMGSQILVAKAYRNSPINFGVSEIHNNDTNKSNALLQTIKNSVLLADKNNCTIKVNVAPPTDMFDTPEVLLRAENYIDAAEKMSEDSPFVTNTTGSVSLNNFLFSIINNNTEEQYLNVIQNLDPNMLSYLIQTDYFNLDREIPKKRVKNITDKEVFYSKNNTFESFNQEVLDQERDKATRSTTMGPILGDVVTKEFYPLQELVYSNMLSNPVSASQVANLALKYGNTRKIEYIAGFKQSQNAVFMREPIWVALTEGVYNNSFDSSNTLMCRLTEYASLFSKYEGVKFPIYDEIFLIGPEPASVGASSAPNPVNTPSLDQQGASDDAAMYAVAQMTHVPYQQPTPPPAAPPEENSPEALYTNGADFLLPNGDRYVGHYHLHYDRSQRKYIAMVGKVHTALPHDTLTPVSNKAQRLLVKASNAGPNGGSNYS